MLRNDYRRALIMFRPLEQGYSGHARLERRTLMGTLCLTASAPGAAALRAALVGRRGNDYFAAPLGAMRRDSRGQYALIASFDPRNIEGKELEDYQLLVVVDAGDPCRLVLSGNVCGSVQMDWERVRREACALFTPGANAREATGAPDAANGEGEAVPWEDAPAAEATEAEADKSASAWENAPAAEVPAEETAAPDWSSAPAVEPALDAAPSPDDHFADAPAVEAALDASQPWPKDFEPVRALFERSEPMEDPPLAGYVFVREDMPEGSSFDYVAVGVRAENGVPVRLAYAFPGTYAPAPPEGLEGCAWFGGAQGWWVRFEPA